MELVSEIVLFEKCWSPDDSETVVLGDPHWWRKYLQIRASRCELSVRSVKKAMNASHASDL
jgi:hypothetical protein